MVKPTGYPTGAATRQKRVAIYFLGGLLPRPVPDGLPVVLGRLGLGLLLGLPPPFPPFLPGINDTSFRRVQEDCRSTAERSQKGHCLYQVGRRPYILFYEYNLIQASGQGSVRIRCPFACGGVILQQVQDERKSGVRDKRKKRGAV